jgi:hypothetical protein
VKGIIVGGGSWAYRIISPEGRENLIGEKALDQH